MAFLQSSPHASRLLILNGNPGRDTLNAAMALSIEAEAIRLGAETG